MHIRALFLALLVATSAQSVRADATPSGTWEPIRERDYWLTGAFITGAALAHFALPDPKGNWSGGILFDDSVRASLSGTTREQRDSAAAWSNGLLIGVVSTPFLLDSVGLTWFRDGNSRSAWRIAMVDIEALAFAEFLTEATKNIAGRKRPYEKTCETTDPNYDAGCFSSDSAQSFISGHTLLAFTSASLLCMTHSELSLFGSRTADHAACAATVSAAIATGVLRIIADRHYASDVIVGAAAGVFAGYVMPRYLHRRETDGEKTSSGFMILPAGSGGMVAYKSFYF